MRHTSFTKFPSHFPAPRLHGDIGRHHKLGEHQIDYGAEWLHDVVHERIGMEARFVVDSELGGKSVNNEAPMAKS
jgi:hypothetical protein